MTLRAMEDPGLIYRQQFRAQDLMRQHPPVLDDENKRIVFEIACPEGAEHQGALEYSRWSATSLPRGVGVDLEQVLSGVLVQSGFYNYERVEIHANAVEWHVNFADPFLFGFYGSPMFAQDELQVAEHPALAALHEALTAHDLRGLTVEDGSPTPVLVAGVERRCQVATEPNAEEGRPFGLYGREFEEANEQAVKRATTRIDPPTVTNLIAIAAPSGGRGRYADVEIAYILVTAYTAFRAAVLESGRIDSQVDAVVVHTGFWGCGAFGGNRVLMTMLQAIAAQMAQVNRIVFHTDAGAHDGADALLTSRRIIGEDLMNRAPLIELRDLIQRVTNLGLAWGSADGN